jgi:hypothetical protein
VWTAGHEEPSSEVPGVILISVNAKMLRPRGL